MIAHIAGRLVEVHDNVVLVDVGGVAYEVEVTSGVLGTLPSSGNALQLYTHLIVREDAQLLYGFASREERELFRGLIRVSGVGPKLALSLLSGMSFVDLTHCVHTNDVAQLTKIPGVGKKTAARLIVELKDRLSKLPPTTMRPRIVVVGEDHVIDATDALLALGYKPLEASQVLEEVIAGRASDEVPTTESVVRDALKRLGQRADARTRDVRTHREISQP